MKNENPFFIQIDKDRIVRSESITFIRYDKDEKNYIIRIDGGDFKFSKENGEKIIEKFCIKK